MSKETSAYVAKMAAKGLKAPESLSMKAIRAICASALAQAEHDALPPWDELTATRKEAFCLCIEQYYYSPRVKAAYEAIRKALR